MFHFLGKYIPRSNKIWLYGGIGKRFIDNSKYLFIILNESEKNIKHIWITDFEEDEAFLKSKGFLCYRKKSLKGVYFSLRAKVYIYSSQPNDINTYAFSGGAFKFNLWHGLPLKKIENDISIGPLREVYHPNGIREQIKLFSNLPSISRKSDAVLCPLNSFKEIFKSAFKVNDSDICLASYPRTEPFFWSRTQLLNYIEKYESIEMKSLIDKCKLYKDVWIYMPTWRDANPNFINQAIPDLAILNEICKKQNILFLLKLHMLTTIEFDKKQLDNLVLIPNHFDVYPLLPFTSTLLTDYSSIFLDYRLLNKKIVFYPFDINDYLSKSREMYFNYDELAIGDKMYSFNELIAFLSNDDEIKISNCSVENNKIKGSEEIVSFIKKQIETL